MEKKYEVIFENSGTAMAIIEEDTTISHVNSEFEKLSGYPREEIEGKKSWAEFVSKEDLDTMKKYHYLRRINPDLAPKKYEFRAIDKDGNIRNFLINVALIPGTKRSIVSLIDITEKHKTEESLKRIINGVVEAMAKLVEEKDPYTAGHQKRVATLSKKISEEMGLPGKTIDAVYIAGLIHDIGKIVVPFDILNKPGKLNELEFNLIKTHPKVAYDILKEVPFPYPVSDIVLQHHERLDGSGYPYSLKDKDILIEAKILAVADVVEAMGSHRPYREALGVSAALEEISQNKNKLYDPKVVDVCIKIFREEKLAF
ncbi:MAG: HD-GYP domain-containing protein [Actinobacteria bacterium]|nr:HD-GYP domain-containing protein [Actinomycetota bacterium]